jgi:hypothetical protein
VTVARSLAAQSTLARKMARPGGRTMGEAVQAAEAGVDSHRDECMRSLSVILAELEEICAARAPDAGDRVYERASAFADMAGFFDTGPLYAAAFSLCETSDRMSAGGCWRWPPIEVHVRAIRLIFAAGCRFTEASHVLLEGLATIVARLPKEGS